MTRLTKTTLITLFVLLVLAASPAQAVPLTFDVSWSGVSFNNSAVATGTIVLESTLLPNPGATNNYLAVTALSITVSGATTGNGTFTRPDFGVWIWNTDGVALDLSQELVGQPVVGGTWGTTGGCCGDFNLFRLNPAAPTGTLHFRLTPVGGQEHMLLTSMKQQVPELSSLMLLAVGALGMLVLIRKKLQA